MSAAKKAPGKKGGEKHHLRYALFGLSVLVSFISLYLILDFQASSDAKLSGDLILGQVDSASYEYHNSPIIGFFFEYCGILSYPLCCLIAYIGYWLFLKPVDIWHINFYKAGLRWLGINLLILGLAGLFSRFIDLGSTGGGGLLGDMLNMFCEYASLPAFVTITLFLIVIYCGISFLFAKSPIFFFDRVGQVFFNLKPNKGRHARALAEGAAVAAGAAAAPAAFADSADDFASENNAHQNPNTRSEPIFNDGFDQDQNFGNAFQQAQQDNGYQNNYDDRYQDQAYADQAENAQGQSRLFFEEDQEDDYNEDRNPSFGESKAPAFANEHSETDAQGGSQGLDFFNAAQNLQSQDLHQQHDINGVADDDSLHGLVQETRGLQPEAPLSPAEETMAPAAQPFATNFNQDQDSLAFGQSQESAPLFNNTNSYRDVETRQDFSDPQPNFASYEQARDPQLYPELQAEQQSASQPQSDFIPDPDDVLTAPLSAQPPAPAFAPEPPQSAFSSSLFEKRASAQRFTNEETLDDDFSNLPPVGLVSEPKPRLFQDDHAQALREGLQMPESSNTFVAPEQSPEPAVEQGAGAVAESQPQEESSPYITPGSSRALREEAAVETPAAESEESSPYITPGVEREHTTPAVEAQPEVESQPEDNGAVHTIIQKVDPAVFAEQQAKIRAEREAAAQKAREAAEAQRLAAEQEAEAQAQAAAEERRQREEAEALAAEEAEKRAQEEAAQAAAQEEEEDSPYMGTYGASRAALRASAKSKEVSEEESSVESEPSVVSDDAPTQPHTIIQKVDPAVFAEQQAQIRAERAAAAAAAQRRQEEEEAAAAAEEQARLAAEAARAEAEAQRLAEEQAEYEAQNFEMPELSADAQAKTHALASEMQSMQGDGEFSISSLVSRAREQEAMSGGADQDREPVVAEPEPAEDRPSTIISRGSSTPQASGDGFDRFDHDSGRTSIIRSTPVSMPSDDDNDFSHFAMKRSNEQSGHGTVAVNMFGDSDEESRPSHSFDFNAASERGSGDDFDESFVGGNSHIVEPPRRTQGFNFADIAREKGGEAAVSRVPGEDNIISFSKFDKEKPKSYEIEHLSSAFIPVSGASDSITDMSGDADEPSTEEQQQARALREKMKALQRKDRDVPDLDEAPAPVKHHLAESESREETHEPEERLSSTFHQQPVEQPVQHHEPEEDDEPEYEAEDEADDAESGAYFDPQQNQMTQMQQPGAMPQYVQLPNGQFVPMMPNTMSMYPGMQMQNMPQYIQLPNGQYVTVQMYQQMMQQNMMQQNMMAAQMAQMQQAQMAQMAQMQQGMMPNQMPPAQEPAQNYAEPEYASQPVYAEEPLTQVQPEPTAPALEAPAPLASQPAPAPVAPAATGEQSQAEPEIPEYSDVTLKAAPDPHTMGENGARGVGLPTAGNAFGGAHNSSSSNLPAYMAGVTQGTSASFDQPQSLSLCSVPRHHFDSWRPDQEILAVSHDTVEISEDDLNHTAERINEVLHSYGIKATVADYLTGPVITRFDLDLAPGVKSSAIVSIETELCRNLLVPNVRVVPIIEGSSYVGLEVPNAKRQFITLGDMVASREFQESKASLPMVLGASVVGKPVVKDLAETPHLLVAGTTGSGKSAGLNTILISLLLKCSPAELRLILVDPKQLEFSIYRDLPHLITPVITDVAEQTPIALHWCVEEMERRFKLMSLLGVRKLAEYNKMVRDAAAQGRSIPDPLWTAEMGPHPQALKPLPWIVIVVEEFADLMAQSSRKKDKDKTAEGYIARLTAKSRAAGIHLVLVTQTPRSEVVNGMIKANIPSRVAFTVQNRIDSNIVLDEKGAECLLGNGDMLYKFSGSSMATRAHGAFTSNDDVKNIVSAWRNYAGAPEYLEDVIAVPPDEDAEVEADAEAAEQKLDVKFDAAANIAREYLERRNKPPSITDLQNDLGVGFPRAKKIYKQLIKEGVLEE